MSWREFQRRRPTESEIVGQFEQNPDANVGVVTGRVSNLLVLDCDAPDALHKLNQGVPETPIAETSRGRHYYFQLPDVRIRSATGLADGLDVRAEGGYVVVPPSVHPQGKRYEWVIPPAGVDPLGTLPAPAPSWLLEMLLAKRRACHDAKATTDIVNGVPEGYRNISSACLIGYLLAWLPPDSWESVAWPLVRSWNQLNRPPLSERELRRVFESIAKREFHKRERTTRTGNALAKALRAALDEFGSLRKFAQQAGIPKSTLADLLKTYASQSHTSTPKGQSLKPPLCGKRTLLESKARTVLHFDLESVRELTND